MTCLSNYFLIKLLSFWFWIQIFIIFNCYFNNITGIVVRPGRVKIIRIEDPRNRDRIDVSNLKAACDPQELSPILLCLDTFIRIYLNRHPPKLTIFTTKFINQDIEQIYLSAIKGIRPVFILSNNLNWTDYNENALETVILLETPESVEYISNDLVYLGDDDCRYAVIITQKFQDEQSFMEVAENLTTILWSKKIVHAAILGAIKKSVVVAKSTSFMSGEAIQPSSPLLMDRCHSEKDWDDEAVDIFIQMDMNNCSIWIGYFIREPYIHLVNDTEKKTSYFDGLETSIFRIIGNKYHIHIHGRKIDWEQGTSIEEIIKKKLETDDAIDIVLGGILWEPQDDIDFTIPYDVVQVVWLIPIHSNISLRGLIAPLQPEVWYAVMLVIIGIVLLRLFLFKDISLLEVVALVIGVGWPKQPENTSSRFQFISYVLFGFLLVQFYLVSMAYQFMRQADIQIDTMSDLVASGLIYGGTKSHHGMFNQAEDTIENDENDFDVLKHIAKHFVIFEQDSYDKLLTELNEGKNTSVALAVTMNMSAVGDTFNHHKIHILDEVLSSYPLAFPLWKGLPYLDRVDDTLRHLIEGDIINYLGRLASWTRDPIFHNDEDPDDFTTLRLNDLAPGFLLLMIGNGLGLICFIIEIIWHKVGFKVCSFWRNTWNKPTSHRHSKLKKKKSKLNKVKKKNIDKKTKARKNNLTSQYKMDSQRVIVHQVIKPNVQIGYYKDIY